MIVAVQGRGIVDPGQPVFRADDEAVLRGAMAFETMRSYAGVPFLLDRHLKRFAGSIEALALPPAPGVEEVLALASRAAPPDHVLRLYRSSLSLVATAAPLPANLEELRARGLALRTVDAGSPSALIAHAKATSYAASFAATRHAIAQGGDDAVLVSQGRVLDAPTANVWAVLGGDLLTPPLGAGVLPGVTRSFLLELGDAQERELTVEELYGADELFITSSIREVMPVTSIDGHAVASGPTAARLQAELRSAT
ncbi:MAG TPA: aminotransferase class IV [Gaiellaceae bacterium]|nr:aminotransferase class IV [Gaiellaceae bacterium]